jgi:hypothetical protein
MEAPAPKVLKRKARGGTTLGLKNGRSSCASFQNYNKKPQNPFGETKCPNSEGTHIILQGLKETRVALQDAHWRRGVDQPGLWGYRELPAS